MNPDQDPAMQSSYATAMLDELVNLRAAFFEAVPEVYKDGRSLEMMGSPLSVIRYVTQHFEKLKENP